MIQHVCSISYRLKCPQCLFGVLLNVMQIAVDQDRILMLSYST